MDPQPGEVLENLFSSKGNRGSDKEGSLPFRCSPLED